MFCEPGLGSSVVVIDIYFCMQLHVQSRLPLFHASQYDEMKVREFPQWLVFLARYRQGFCFTPQAAVAQW